MKGGNNRSIDYRWEGENVKNENLFEQKPSVACWIVSLQKDMLNLYSVIALNVYLFGNKVFTDTLKLRWGHTGLGWVLIQWSVSL